MDDIQTLLNEEIVRRLKELPTLDSGTKEIGAAIEDIEHLCKIRLAELQQDCEAQARAREEHDKLAEDAGRAKERYIRFGLDAAGLILPLIFYGVWMKRGFEFEKEGVFTSTTFRSLFNRFKPTK